MLNGWVLGMSIFGSAEISYGKPPNSGVGYAAFGHIIVAAAESAPAPICIVTGRTIANSLQELPASVRKALAHRIADRGQPFIISDAIHAGQKRRPFIQLICGYLIPDGYVVEREQGGRGYNVGKIVFDKIAVGYVEPR